MTRTYLLQFSVLFCAALCLIGCSKKPPATTSAEGIVTLNGQPLPHAEVKFFPQAPGLDMNYASTAVTDAQGRFTLKMIGSNENGVCVCKHQVTVTEGPLPDEARSNSDKAQLVAAQFIQSLKNRPIPELYANLVTSPIQVEIVPDQPEIKIELLGR